MEGECTGHGLAVVNQGSQFDECGPFNSAFKVDDVDQTVSYQGRYVNGYWLIVSTFGVGYPCVDRFVLEHILNYLEPYVDCDGDLSETPGCIQVEETTGAQYKTPSGVSHGCLFTLRLLSEEAAGEVDGQRFKVSFITKVRRVGQPLYCPPCRYPVNPQKSR